MIKKCLLCKSEKIKVKQVVSKKEIVKIYQDNFNFDVSSELSNESINYYKCNNCSLNFFEPNTAGGGLFYENLQENRTQYYNPLRNEFLFAKEFIKPTANVLEIGAGYGYFAKLISYNSYVGLEFNDQAINIARSEGIDLIKEDVVEFSKKNINKFDVVCSFHVLEHVKNPKEFIEAALEVTKVGGKLIIAVPCNNSISTNNFNHVLNMPPHHISRYYLETMKYFEKMFKIKLVNYKIDFINENSSKKNYLTESITKKVIRLLYPSKVVIIDNDKYAFIKKNIHKINNKLRLYKCFNINPLGENMTFVFEKL